MSTISLVIFTCETREHLLKKTIDSFREHCDFKFDKIILAIDGSVAPDIVNYIQPDLCVRNFSRGGYVKNIINATKLIDTDYFFILEDDWSFHKPVEIKVMVDHLDAHQNWFEIVYSKTGALTAEQKTTELANNLFQFPEFSTNPALIRSDTFKNAFSELQTKEKTGKTLGEDGFENFLTRYMTANNYIGAMHDPITGTVISHEGYLESTPRSWHMTNSIENRPTEHLLTIPVPSYFRRMKMVLKLMITTTSLAMKQFRSDSIYEFCFRIIAESKRIK